MKNTLVDLNNHIFAQLERLNKDDLTADELKQECDRSKAIATLASQAISNSRLVLDAEIAKNDFGISSLNPSRIASDNQRVKLIQDVTRN
jgi:hypothetical protein